VATYQQVAGSFALLMVLVLPTIIDQLRPGDSGLRLAAMGAAVLVSLVIALPLTLRAFPEQAPGRHRPARHRSAASPLAAR
jgi:Na+/melibiose symporter-like transporter